MALYRCAACGSPNVVTDTQIGGLKYDYLKEMCIRDRLLIVLHELVFLLQLLDNGGRERLAGNLGVEEHQIAVFRREFLAERAFQHRSRPRVVIGAKLGPRFVPELLLSLIHI